MKRYFAFDLETTGVDVVNDEPVEIGFAVVNEDGTFVEGPTSFFVNTKRPVNPGAAKCHGITKEQMESGMAPGIVCQVIHQVFQRHQIDAILGFNCFKFDVPMLHNFLIRHNGMSFMDGFQIEDPAMWFLADDIYKVSRPMTLDDLGVVADRRVPYGTKFNLGFLCGKFGVTHQNAHRAEGDLLATIDLWKKMKASPVNQAL